MDTFPAGHQMSSLQRGVCAGQEERREGLNPTALVPWNEEDGADISVCGVSAGCCTVQGLGGGDCLVLYCFASFKNQCV